MHYINEIEISRPDFFSFCFISFTSSERNNIRCKEKLFALAIGLYKSSYQFQICKVLKNGDSKSIQCTIRTTKVKLVIVLP